MVLRCAADAWHENARMPECFDASLVVVTGPLEDHLEAARGLVGHLTGTIHSEADDANYAEQLHDVLMRASDACLRRVPDRCRRDVVHAALRSVPDDDLAAAHLRRDDGHAPLPAPDHLSG